MGDQRALFSSNDTGMIADGAFVNREDQCRAISAALSAHLERIADPAFDVEGLEAPRSNVLVFHGVGEIGKTTSSRTLESAVDEQKQWLSLST